MTGKTANVEKQLSALQAMDKVALRARWKDAFKHPAPMRASRDLIIRALAYQVQAKAYGDLRPATLRRLQRLAADLQAGRDAGRATAPSLSPGVRLMREWNGETHVVEVLKEGFSWQGNCYPSLSAAARAITGVRWSGPRFFGLIEARESSSPRKNLDKQRGAA